MNEILIGLVGGILVGATGAGFSLITPLLVLVGYRPSVAVGTGLANLVLSKLIGTAFHKRLGHVPKGNLLTVIIGGAVGVGIFALATWHRNSVNTEQLDHKIKLLLAFVLLFTAVAIQFSAEPRVNGKLKALQDKPLVLFVIGCVVSFVVVATAAGSGTLLVPALLLTSSWRVQELAAVSNVYGLAVGLLGFLVQWRFGFFDRHLFLLNLIGLLPGVAVGALLSRKIPRKWFVRVMGVGSIALSVSLFLHH